jgi:hypothetical protein
VVTVVTSGSFAHQFSVSPPWFAYLTPEPFCTKFGIGWNYHLLVQFLNSLISNITSFDEREKKRVKLVAYYISPHGFLESYSRETLVKFKSFYCTVEHFSAFNNSYTIISKGATSLGKSGSTRESRSEGRKKRRQTKIKHFELLLHVPDVRSSNLCFKLFI